MSLLMLATLAFAGKLEVRTEKPVILLIDNEPVDFLEGRMDIMTAPLRDGSHLVEVRNLMGKRITELEVKVPHDQIVRVDYADKRLAIQGSRYVYGGAIVPAADVAPVESTVSTVDLAPAPDSLTTSDLPETVPVGSLEFVLPASTTVVVGGKELTFSSHTESFVASELVPGKLTVSVASDGESLFDGDLQTRERQNYRCLKAEGTLECKYVTPQLGLPEIARALANTEIQDALASTNPDPKAASGPVTVIFTIRDDFDYSTVFLDGARVAKFLKGTTEQTIEVQSGVHVVEIRGFDDTRWYRGKFTAPVGTPIEISFGEDEGLDITSSNGSWDDF
jgi:hypothetical protein